MKVSILMAVYNGENYLRESMNSLLNQSHPDLEIVICDDGSTDSTGSILGQYGEKGNIVVLHEPHRGMVHAFNKAYAASSGDAICFLAHDDYLPPDSIEGRVRVLAGGAKAVFCNGYVCDSLLNPVRLMVRHPAPLLWQRDNVLVCRNNFLAGALLMITRDLAGRIFPIPEELPFEDWWVVFNTLFYAGLIESIDQPLFFYRIHEANDTGLPNWRVFDETIRFAWKKHPGYYNILEERLKEWNLGVSEREKLLEIVQRNRDLVRRTLEGKGTLPSPGLLKAAGIPKYLYSQATLVRAAFLFFLVFDALQKFS